MTIKLKDLLGDKMLHKIITMMGGKDTIYWNGYNQSIEEISNIEITNEMLEKALKHLSNG